MSAIKRIIRIGSNFAVKKVQTSGSLGYYSQKSNGLQTKFQKVSTVSAVKKVPYDRQISYGERAHLVKNLEERGIPFNHAEAIISALTLVLDGGLDNISNNIIPKAMDKIEISQERNSSSFKSEIQICQDHRLACHQHDTEKIINDMQIDSEKLRCDIRQENEKLKNNIAKMRGELRSEVEKVTARAKLENSNLMKSLDGQTEALNAYLEKSKDFVLVLCVLTVFTVSAVCMATLAYSPTSIEGTVEETSQGS